MEESTYIVFSYYYINHQNEIDKILKEKYYLQTSSILTHQELYRNIMKHKLLYTKPTTLHEILVYETDINSYERPQFTKTNVCKDIHLAPSEDSEYNMSGLSRIYVFFRLKEYPSRKTLKNKFHLKTQKTRKLVLSETISN